MIDSNGITYPTIYLVGSYGRTSLIGYPMPDDFILEGPASYPESGKVSCPRCFGGAGWKKSNLVWKNCPTCDGRGTIDAP